jgi:hypothetical protein
MAPILNKAAILIDAERKLVQFRFAIVGNRSKDE